MLSWVIAFSIWEIPLTRDTLAFDDAAQVASKSPRPADELLVR
jgi:hypothetical protein